MLSATQYLYPSLHSLPFEINYVLLFSMAFTISCLALIHSALSCSRHPKAPTISRFVFRSSVLHSLLARSEAQECSMCRRTTLSNHRLSYLRPHDVPRLNFLANGMDVWILLRFDMTSFSFQHAGAKPWTMPISPNVKQRKLLYNLTLLRQQKARVVHRIYIYARKFPQFRWYRRYMSFVNIDHSAYKFPIVSVFLACLPST